MSASIPIMTALANLIIRQASYCFPSRADFKSLGSTTRPDRIGMDDE